MDNEPQDEWADFRTSQPSTAGQPDDEWAAFRQPTMQTSGEAMQKGAVGGLIESSTMLTGAIAGAKVGAVGGPWGAAAGAIAGGVGGMFLGGEIRESAAEQGWTYSDIEQISPENRPSAFAGEAFGGAVPFIGAPVGFGIAGIRTAGVSKVGKFVNEILDTAQRMPLRFLGAETAAAGSSAAGAYAAESYDPGNMPLRLGAEVAGGFFNPTRVVNSLYETSVSTVKTLYQRFTPAGRESKAAQVLAEILTAGGEDPKAVVRMLDEVAKDPQFKDLNLNVAQLTGSKQLGALQDQLAVFSKNFGAQSQEQAENGTKALVGMIELLSRTGDPEALRTAAKLKQNLMTSQLVSRLQEAEQAAYDAAMKITKDTPSAKAEISKVARNAMNGALRDARKAESELWALVPKDIAVKPEQLVMRFINLAEDMLPEARKADLPDIAIAFIKRIRKEGATASDYTQFRSKMLSMAREASEAGKYNEARITGALAEAALDDLDLAFSGDKAYDAARQFSKSLNDTFTRSFAGKAMATGQYGDRVPPELLLQRAMSTGGEAANLQLADLEEATRFMVTRGLEDNGAVELMMDAQERIIRLAAAEAIDPISQKASPKKLAAFMQKNEALLKRFPQVKAQLQDAMKTEIGATAIEAVSKRSSRAFETQTAYAKVLKRDPVKAAQMALTSTDQEKELLKLVKVAKSAGDTQTMQGLRTAVMEAALRKATTQSGNLNFEQLQTLLTKPAVAGKQSPLDILKSSGAFTAADVRNINKIFDMAKRISTAQKPGVAIDDVEDATGMLMDVVTRGVGATIATKAAQVSGTEAASRGLIIAGAGSRAARRLTQNLPNAAIKNVLIEAMTNPKFMKKLLEKAPDDAAQMAKVRYIHAYLIQSGIYNIEDTLESEQPPVSMTESALSVL